MNTSAASSNGLLSRIYLRLTDYAVLTKVRLSLLVVFSAAIGYVFSGVTIQASPMLVLILGGLLVTASSNAINQVLEKDTDKLMPRTLNRPLPTSRMSTLEAVIAAGIMGVTGIALLSFYFNTLAGVLSALSLLSYAFVYTPLKRITPLAVFVGAFPGAFPVLIGYVCAVGVIDFQAMILFSVQFLWQFPHFWAIAWVSFEDYLKGGFMLLPSASGRSRSSAMQCLLYCAFLLIVSMMPYFLGLISLPGATVVFLAGSIFFYQAYRLYQYTSIAAARQLMFGSFIYLPVVQLAFILSKLQ